MSLQYLPAQKFEGDEPLTKKEMQKAHEQNILEQTAIDQKADLATAHHLGELNDTFTVDDILSKYTDGQQLRFTHNGDDYFGVIINGIVKCAVLTDARFLST